MNAIKLLSTIFVCTALCFLTSCKEDPDPVVENDFTLMGAWNFDNVKASASIFSDEDTDPSGCISFEDDNKGVLSYDFTLGGNNFVRTNDTITWVPDGKMPPEVVTITQSDGQIFDYHFSEGSESSCVAQFIFPAPITQLGGTVDLETVVQLSKK